MTPGLGLRLLADDLTGALDSAAAFAPGVPVHLDTVPGNAPPAPVVALATGTRDVPPHTLPQRLASALVWFAGGTLAFKKVDSLLRGNTFAECAWLAQAGRFDGVVFAPAYPAQRRLTRAAQQRVVHAAQEAATEAPGAAPGWADTLGDPVGGSMVEAFAELGLPVHTGLLPPVAQEDAPHDKIPVWVPDVGSDADLLRLARRAWPGPDALPGRWLWCGSAGLAHALAAVQPGHGLTMPAGPAPSAPPASASVLMLGASHHAVVRRQWDHLRQACPTALHVVRGSLRQFAGACKALQRPFDVAALELSPAEPLDAAQAATLLAHQVGELVARVAPPAAVLVVGGDTLLALCRASGAATLHTRAALRPGWGHAVLVGGRWDGVDCHTRSGAFGPEDDLHGMLKQVQAALR